MRTGIVLVTRWWRGSIDHEGCAAALKELGCEPLLICRGNDAGEADFEVVTTTAQEQECVEFWKALGLDGAVVWNWLHGSAMIQAMKEAGIRTLLRADTDGLVSDAEFPWRRFKLTIGNGATLRSKLGLARHFLGSLKSARARDSELIETIRLADGVAVETETARRNITRVLRVNGASDLAAKLQVVPHAVSDSLMEGPLPMASDKKVKIYCGGRWDSPQKDAGLLQRTLGKVLALRPDCQVVISGPIDSNHRAALCTISGNIVCTGLIGRDAVVRHLRESQIILSSSRWETQPIGALEALCMGCTAVAPPLPGFMDMLEGDRFGTLASQRSASALAQACLRELDCWQQNLRHAHKIAAHWRSLVSNKRVVRKLLPLLRYPHRAEAHV